MSLSSSIEFEARPDRNRSRDTEEIISNRERHQPPPRVPYPPSASSCQSENDGTSPTVGTSHHEKVVVIPIVRTGERYFQSPKKFSECQEQSSPAVGSALSTLSSASRTTRSNVPLTPHITESVSTDDGNFMGPELGRRYGQLHGDEVLLNGENGVDVGEDNYRDEMVASESHISGEVPKADRFGFLGGSGTEIKLPVEVFRRRESKWLEMLGNWQFYMTKRFDKVRARCRKGIPSSIRPRAWKYLCGAQFFMTSGKTKDIFEILDKNPGDSHWNGEILKDLNRQFPNHEMFSQATPYGKFGQEDLFRVLKAWTLLHPEEGYCQAQAPIASALLMHMPAHEAFYCFAQICQKYLPGYFSPGLEAVQLDGDILFGLLKKHSYSSYKHLKKQNIDPVLYMVEWFMCIYCRTLPWSCVLRVLDMFFCEGVKILFKVGVFLFKYGLSSREQLRACPAMYETIERLRHLPIENLNEEYLVQKIVEMNITDEDLERIHYKQVKTRNKKQKSRGHVTI